MTVSQIASNMPRFAPLPIPTVLHLLKQQHKHLKKMGGASSPEELDHMAWVLLEKKVREKRESIYAYLDPLVRSSQVGSKTELSTTWIRRVLTAYTPGKKNVPVQTLSLWRERNLLRYREWGRPDPDSAAALLLARMVDERIRNWLPTTLEDEAYWWCWRQDTPESSPVPCPVPLPNDLPPTTLLWTPWRGAAWDPHWMKVGNNLGAIRWARAVIENQHLRWVITEQDLQCWDPEVAALNIMFPECAQDILQTVATLALYRLAQARFHGPLDRESNK